ncbi:hypothetical protein BSL78_20163 [Apostichopus japonicus]|uniref:Uncharacterized protein n=1 Tax=Stichopus japonicus TaxID=307972 RepID=A0A2G8K4R5_STIJA|nr:hypothetical protein BSL78_20163 [Apostichopus japonicus]
MGKIIQNASLMLIALAVFCANAENCFTNENATCASASTFILEDRPCHVCECDESGTGYQCCVTIDVPKVRYPHRCNLVLDEDKCEYKRKPYPACYARACEIITA